MTMLAAERPAIDDRSGQVETVARTRDLRKTFGETVALGGVDLDVRRGELVALLGASGSGKSTLLRCLNGLHRPSSGEVDVLGTDVGAARESTLRRLRGRIGFVFQGFNLVARMSALENVLVGGLSRLRGPRYGVSTYPRRM